MTEGAGDRIPAKPGPEEALGMLREGNRRFLTGGAVRPHACSGRVALAARADQGDHAFATILACSDSRVPVEIIFDAGIMDLFVTRVAGNICDRDEIGTIEYGLVHVRTPLVVILGHTQCGAIIAATRAYQGRSAPHECSIDALVDWAEPACRLAAEGHPEASDDDLIPHAIEENVWRGIRSLFTASAISRDYVRQGRAKVVGAVYDLATGKVLWLPEKRAMDILGEVEGP
jgi:carbonic anhydrase